MAAKKAVQLAAVLLERFAVYPYSIGSAKRPGHAGCAAFSL